jgi:O-acetyl-ADP-ribose deacetylase (regulator of RNase III)
MKIIYKKGDLFECEEKIIIHGCNAQGRMGAGVAKLIKQKYHPAYLSYREAYDTRGLKLGDVVWASCDDKTIGNAIIQEFYGRDKRVYVSYPSLRKCMNRINTSTIITSGDFIAMPKIGAGLAGGDWRTIEKIIEEESTNFQPVVYTQ